MFVEYVEDYKPQPIKSLAKASFKFVGKSTFAYILSAGFTPGGLQLPDDTGVHPWSDPVGDGAEVFLWRQSYGIEPQPC